MAIIYVDSVGGSNTSPYDTWAKAATTVQTALTAWTDGDEIWIEDSHTENPAADITWTAGSSTIANRVPMYRMTSANVYSPTTGADTAQVNLSGTAAADLFTNFHFAMYGLNLQVGNNIEMDLAGYSGIFEDCYLEGATSGSQLNVGSTNCDAATEFKNCEIDFTNTGGGSIELLGYTEFNGCTFSGYAASAGLLQPGSLNRAYRCIFRGCDFSGMTFNASGPVVDTSAFSDSWFQVDIINCDVPASQSYTDGTFTTDNQFVTVWATDSGGNLYQTDRYGFRGDVNTDTATYRDAGYQDRDGTTNLSMEMVPASNVDIASPLVSIDIPFKITTTGAKTFTVECVENYTTALTQRDAWIEVYYLGSATETLHTITNDNREFAAASYTNLAAGTGLANWTGEPASSRSVKLTATATVNQTGIHVARVFLANYESTKQFFYDPVVTVS